MISLQLKIVCRIVFSLKTLLHLICVYLNHLQGLLPTNESCVLSIAWFISAHFLALLFQFYAIQFCCIFKLFTHRHNTRIYFAYPFEYFWYCRLSRSWQNSAILINQFRWDAPSERHSFFNTHKIFFHSIFFR